MTRLAWAAALGLVLSGCGSPPYLEARAPRTAATRAGVERSTGAFHGAGGVMLYEQSWRPTAPARAVLVVVHGLKDHSDRYAGFAETLAAHGYAVYAFDLRGHAHSAGERVYVDSFDDYLGDLDVFMKRVAAAEPGKPLFLFGHSMGGAIVTLYTLNQNPPLSGLILSGAALDVDVSGFKVFGTRVVASLSPHAGVFQLDLDDFSRDRQVVQAGKSDPLVYQDGAPARTAKELIGAIDTIDERMTEMCVPLLIMHGGADVVTPPQGSRELFARAPSPDKTLKIYDGLYHDLLHEPEHAVIERDILAWMDKRAPAPTSTSP